MRLDDSKDRGKVNAQRLLLADRCASHGTFTIRRRQCNRRPLGAAQRR